MRKHLQHLLSELNACQNNAHTSTGANQGKARQLWLSLLLVLPLGCWANAPTANNDIATTYSGGNITFNVVSNDTRRGNGNKSNDINSASVILSQGAANAGVNQSIAGSNGGAFSVDATGTVTFTAPALVASATTSSVNYTVADGNGFRSTSAIITVTINPAADVTTALTGPAAMPRSQETGNFTVTFANNGPNIAPNVTRSVTLPTGATNVTAPGGTVSGLTITYPTLTNQPSGASETFIFRYTTPPTTSITAVNTRSNTAVSGINEGANRSPNQSTVTTTLSAATTSADVATTLNGPSPNNAPAGSYVTYTLTATNSGAATATGVIPQIQLPTNLETVTASNSAAYNPSNGVVVFPSENYTSGQTRTYTVRFVMPANNGVTGVASSYSSTTSDATPANNNGTGANASFTTTTTQIADVAAAITGPGQTAPRGRTILALVASNYGPSTATGIQLTATLSRDLRDVVVSDGGSYDASTGIVTMPVINRLEALTSKKFTLTLTAPSQASTPIRGTIRASSTTANGDPAPANNDGSDAASNILVGINYTVSSQDCLKPTTQDLSSTASSPNSYYPGLGTASANGTSLTVGPAVVTGGASNAIVAGDLVVIIQMQGGQIDYTNTDAYGDGVSSILAPANGMLQSNLTAGRYEYRYVDSTSAPATAGAGGTITLKTPLTYTYTNADATSTAGQQRYQVIRVPRYRNIVLEADMAVPAWNGKTGGIVVLEANGTLNFNGKTINGNGKGFRGGAGRILRGGAAAAGASVTDYVSLSTLAIHASKGEGIVGTPRYVNNGGTAPLDNLLEGYPGGSYGRGAPGNAGGGGTDGDLVINENNSGGGGGSNGGFGGQGGNTWSQGAPTGGNGGAPFILASPSRIVMGGGGGAGVSNNGSGDTGNTGFNSSGTAGGGIVIINTNAVTGTGTINVNGADNTFTVGPDGSGGAGAGGSVVLFSRGLNDLSNITVLANGGKGGDNNLGAVDQHGPGGGGSAGVIFSSSSTSSFSRIEPGASGISGSNNGAFPFGATIGTSFRDLVRTDIAQSDVPNITQASNCIPLPVELISFTAKAAGQDAQLAWRTAQELHNDHFLVERSFDGQSFSSVGQIQGQGTTNLATDYKFTDEQAAPKATGQIVYYRLRQVDTDGTASFSSVQVVTFAKVAAAISLYPNPATTGTKLNLTSLPQGTYQVRVHDMTGRLVHQASAKGGLIYELPVGQWPAGVYMVQVKSQTLIKTARLIKK